VFDNDGTLWTEQPLYPQLASALDRAAELGHPVSQEELQAGGMDALTDLIGLTHAGITTDEFDVVCRSWLAAARHPRFGWPYLQTVYQPMLELLHHLGASGFSCWIFSGGGTDFMWATVADVYGLRPHRVIGSAGETCRVLQLGHGLCSAVQTADSYSLSKPPRTGRRRILPWAGLGTGDPHVVGEAAALDAAAACCNARHMRQAPGGGVAPRRSASGW
jgi:hypothetical protein